jgi:SAM-dependent methyltransferase
MSDQIAKMRNDRDAYGHELYNFWKDGNEHEIIERDDGLIDASDHVGGYFADFKNWPVYEQEGMAFLAPGRSLDLGCGAGRVELYLQSQNREITGIDNSPLAVQVCRERGVKDARLMPVEKITTDVGMFSNIIMYGNNWGLMANPRQAKRLLRLFHRITNPGARILAESNNIYQTDNALHLAYQAWNRQRSRMPGQIRLRVRCGIHCSKWFDYLMVSKEEMEGILEGTGWKIIHTIDSTGSTYVAVLARE